MKENSKWEYCKEAWAYLSKGKLDILRIEMFREVEFLLKEGKEEEAVSYEADIYFLD